MGFFMSSPVMAPPIIQAAPAICSIVMLSPKRSKYHGGQRFKIAADGNGLHLQFRQRGKIQITAKPGIDYAKNKNPHPRLVRHMNNKRLLKTDKYGDGKETDR